MHHYCVFDYFLFNLVNITGGELKKVHDYCVFDCFLFNLVTISGGELHKVLDYCVLNFFSSLLSSFQDVSYMKCIIIVFF